MRYIDLEVAAMIGLSSVSGIIALTPRASDSASRLQASESALRDELLSYIQERGAAWLLSVPPQEICSDMASISNSTASFNAVVGGQPCPRTPVGAPAVDLSLNLTLRQLVLEGWLPGQG